MHWIEVVTLRAFTTEDRAGLSEQLRQMLRAVSTPGLVRHIVCHEAVIPTDLSIFLAWEQPGAPGKSPLGLRLAAMLSEFGLIYHTVWVDA